MNLPRETIAELKPAIRAFSVLEGSFIQIAVRNAFWDRSRAVVLEYAQHFGVPVAPNGTLFDLLWLCCKWILDASDDEALDKLEEQALPTGFHVATAEEQER